MSRDRFFFAIPFAPRRDDASWRRSLGLLGQTLGSLVRQTDPHWTAIVCGHEPPQVAEMADPRIGFIALGAGAAQPLGARDKIAKHSAILRRVRLEGGGYVMMLDADDLVHRRLVEFVRAHEHPNGYVITEGFQEDVRTGALRRIPGLRGLPFHRVCGSCAIFRLAPEEIGDGRTRAKSYADNFVLKGHGHWAKEAEALGRPLGDVPFPAAVYRFNTGVNLTLRRNGGLRYGLVAARINVLRIWRGLKQIRADFYPD